MSLPFFIRRICGLNTFTFTLVVVFGVAIFFTRHFGVIPGPWVHPPEHATYCRLFLRFMNLQNMKMVLFRDPTNVLMVHLIMYRVHKITLSNNHLVCYIHKHLCFAFGIQKSYAFWKIILQKMHTIRQQKMCL